MKTYARNLLLRGFHPECRGRLLIIRCEATGKAFMIGGGTIVEAIYLAYKTNPQNAHMEMLCKNGIDDVIEILGDAPSDIIKYMKTEHNLHHRGGSTTLGEWPYSMLKHNSCATQTNLHFV